MSSSQWLFDARRFDVVAELVSMLRNQRLSCPRVDGDLLKPAIVADDVMMFDRLCAGTFLNLGCVLGHGCYRNVSRVGSLPGEATFSARWPANGICSYKKPCSASTIKPFHQQNHTMLYEQQEGA
jgi:hypothetical protein